MNDTQLKRHQRCQDISQYYFPGQSQSIRLLGLKMILSWKTDTLKVKVELSEKEYDEDCKEWRKYDRRCESLFDKYLECIGELPGREAKQIEDSELY